MRYSYRTRGTCAVQINFDIEGDKIYNVQFIGGCNGNLKAISKFIDGMTVSEIESKLKGNTCNNKQTSCADQLALAVRAALNNK